MQVTGALWRRLHGNFAPKPTCAVTWNFFGLAHAMLGNLNGAREALIEAVQSLKFAPAHFNLANVLEI